MTFSRRLIVNGTLGKCEAVIHARVDFHLGATLRVRDGLLQTAPHFGGTPVVDLGAAEVQPCVRPIRC
jgi:hypothetical protein